MRWSAARRTCAAISSRTSISILRGSSARIRNSLRNGRERDIDACLCGASCQREQGSDGAAVLHPRFGFGAQMATSSGGELVVARLAFVFRHAPFAFDVAAPFEPMQDLVHRAVVHPEHA